MCSSGKYSWDTTPWVSITKIFSFSIYQICVLILLDVNNLIMKYSLQNDSLKYFEWVTYQYLEKNENNSLSHNVQNFLYSKNMRQWNWSSFQNCIYHIIIQILPHKTLYNTETAHSMHPLRIEYELFVYMHIHRLWTYIS